MFSEQLFCSFNSVWDAVDYFFPKFNNAPTPIATRVAAKHFPAVDPCTTPVAEPSITSARIVTTNEDRRTTIICARGNLGTPVNSFFFENSQRVFCKFNVF